MAFRRKPRGTSKASTSTYKSSLEQAVALGLEALGVPVLYEAERVAYEVPAKQHHYKPDFLLPNGIRIEAKGYFTADDRKKMLAVKASHPFMDIRFVFGRAANKLNKDSPTTYSMWADSHGFKWAEKVVPRAWLEEPSPN